jgi:hypothetical protein
MARTTTDKTVVKPITLPGSIALAAKAKADKEYRGNFSMTMALMAEKQLTEEGYLKASNKK